MKDPRLGTHDPLMATCLAYADPYNCRDGVPLFSDIRMEAYLRLLIFTGRSILQQPAQQPERPMLQQEKGVPTTRADRGRRVVDK